MSAPGGSSGKANSDWAITIFVENTASRCPIEIDSFDTVKDVKEAYEQITGLPSCQCLLAFRGKRLKDEKAIAEYNIQNGAVLQQYMTTEWNIEAEARWAKK